MEETKAAEPTYYRPLRMALLILAGALVGWVGINHLGRGHSYGFVILIVGLAAVVVGVVRLARN